MVKKPGLDNSEPGNVTGTDAGVVGDNTPVVWLMVNIETVPSSLLAV